MDKIIKYWLLSIGTSLAPILVEVMKKIPQDIREHILPMALDTNNHIHTYKEKGLHTFLLGEKSRKGKGCGGKRQLGAGAFEESKEELFTQLGSTSDIESAVVISGPDRGGTGSGGVVKLCESLRSRNIPVILFVIKASEFALEVGTQQVEDFNAVSEELYQKGIKFFLLDSDWVYKNSELSKSSLSVARVRLNDQIAAGISMVSIFWRGDKFIDRADLEEQVLAGAGNIKMATTEVDLEASDPAVEVKRAVKNCLEHNLFSLLGPVNYVVSYRSGSWRPEHNRALGESLKGYCKESLEQWNSSKGTPDYQLLFVHKQVDLDSEPEEETAPFVVAEDSGYFKNRFPFDESPVEVERSGQPAKGTLTLLISTFIPTNESAQNPVSADPGPIAAEHNLSLVPSRALPDKSNVIYASFSDLVTAAASVPGDKTALQILKDGDPNHKTVVTGLLTSEVLPFNRVGSEWGDVVVEMLPSLLELKRRQMAKGSPAFSEAWLKVMREGVLTKNNFLPSKVGRDEISYTSLPNLQGRSWWPALNQSDREIIEVGCKVSLFFGVNFLPKLKSDRVIEVSAVGKIQNGIRTVGATMAEALKS